MSNKFIKLDCTGIRRKMGDTKKEKSVKIKIINAPPGDDFKMPSLGIAYVSSALKNKGYDIELFDLDILMHSEEELYSKIRMLVSKFHASEFYSHVKNMLSKKSPGLGRYEKNFLLLSLGFMKKYAEKIAKDAKYVLFSANLQNIAFSLILAKYIKHLDSGIKIIFGGPECDVSNKFILNFSFVDFVVLGDAERTIAELVEALEHSKNVDEIKGLAYKRNNNFVVNPGNAYIADIDNLPFPDFDIYDLESYPHKIIPIHSARGCPFHCTFCRKIKKGFSLRAPEKVANEVTYLSGKYNVKKFIFSEDITNSTPLFFSKLCDALINEGVDAVFAANVKPRGMPYPLLKKAHSAGFRYFLWGIESGSQDVLNSMKKETKIDEISELLKNSAEIGIKNMCSFIAGYPPETDSDFAKTLDFVRKNKKYIDFISCHAIQFYEEADDSLQKYLSEKPASYWISEANKKMDVLAKLIKKEGINTNLYSLDFFS